jgi:hypothetical protein
VKKLTIPALLAMGALAVPAVGVADKPSDPGAKGKAHKKAKDACKTHKVGFVASGVLTSAATVTQTAGQGTPDTSDDRYDVSGTANITKTNHHAKGYKGTQTVTLTGVRVKFGEGVVNPPAAGTLVKAIGKVTAVNKKKCPAGTGAGVVTIRQVNFSAPAPAPAPAT